jgi:predicted secreted hydrolase
VSGSERWAVGSRWTSAVVATLVFAGFGAIGARGTCEEPAEWKRASRDHEWDFPRDHFAHPGYSIEWWYFTGELRDDASRREFGYQFTVFRVGMTAEPPRPGSDLATDAVFMGNAAITEFATGTHRFADVLWRAAPLTGGFSASPTESPIARAPAAPGSAGEWRLDFADGEFRFAMQDDALGLAFDLAARPVEPLVFQGENGLSVKEASGGAASLYYSFTRLATRGSLRLGDASSAALEVTGESWMDHEISSDSLSDAQVGWDWFSIRFDDGVDLMLYGLRRADGSYDFARGTIVSADRKVRWLTQDEWTARPGPIWTSGATRASYPVEWRVDLRDLGLSFTTHARVPASENVSSKVKGLHYWEGAVEVRDLAGRKIGRGYVELTGYGDDARLPL